MLSNNICMITVLYTLKTASTDAVIYIVKARFLGRYFQFMLVLTQVVQEALPSKQELCLSEFGTAMFNVLFWGHWLAFLDNLASQITFFNPEINLFDNDSLQNKGWLY